MADFLRFSAGTWLSVRSVHHFDFSPDQSGDSNLIITLLDREDEAVQTGLPAAARRGQQRHRRGAFLLARHPQAGSR